MPRKSASTKKETATPKKTTRKKNAVVEAVVETTPIEIAVESHVAEPVVEVPIVDTHAADTPTEAPKKTRKPRAKKVDKKAEPVLTIVVQVGDAEFDITDIAAKAYKAYKSVHKRKTVTDFRVYVKPEEGAAYYTVNGEGAPDYKIDL